MADTYRVQITPNVLADLERIFDHIQQTSPKNAKAMIERLLDAIDSLDTFPRRHSTPRGAMVRGRQVRSMVVRPFLVRYRIEESTQTVYVLRIRHGARRNP